MYSRVPFTSERKCRVAELGAMVLYELMGARVLKAPGITVQESWLQWRNQKLQLFLLYLPGGEHMASEKERDMYKEGKTLLHWDVGLGWVGGVNVEKWRGIWEGVMLLCLFLQEGLGYLVESGAA